MEKMLSAKLRTACENMHFFFLFRGACSVYVENGLSSIISVRSCDQPGTSLRLDVWLRISGLSIPMRFPYVQCPIDEIIKGAASLRRYGITFDDKIDVKYKTPQVVWTIRKYFNCQDAPSVNLNWSEKLKLKDSYLKMERVEKLFISM